MNVEPKTVVKNWECDCCGAPVAVRLDKNRKAYFQCQAPDETGEPCGRRSWYGAKVSRQLSMEYLKEQAEKNNVSVESKKPDSGGEPSGGTAPERTHPKPTGKPTGRDDSGNSLFSG